LAIKVISWYLELVFNPIFTLTLTQIEPKNKLTVNTILPAQLIQNLIKFLKIFYKLSLVKFAYGRLVLSTCQYYDTTPATLKRCSLQKSLKVTQKNHLVLLNTMTHFVVT